MSELNILIVEDLVTDAELCEHELRRAGVQFKSRRVCTRATFEQALGEFVPDLILSDFSMPTDASRRSCFACCNVTKRRVTTSANRWR